MRTIIAATLAIAVAATAQRPELKQLMAEANTSVGGMPATLLSVPALLEPEYEVIEYDDVPESESLIVPAPDIKLSQRDYPVTPIVDCGDVAERVDELADQVSALTLGVNALSGAVEESIRRPPVQQAQQPQREPEPRGEVIELIDFMLAEFRGEPVAPEFGAIGDYLVSEYGFRRSEIAGLSARGMGRINAALKQYSFNEWIAAKEDSQADEFESRVMQIRQSRKERRAPVRASNRTTPPVTEYVESAAPMYSAPVFESYSVGPPVYESITVGPPVYESRSTYVSPPIYQSAPMFAPGNCPGGVCPVPQMRGFQW